MTSATVASADIELNSAIIQFILCLVERHDCKGLAELGCDDEMIDRVLNADPGVLKQMIVGPRIGRCVVSTEIMSTLFGPAEENLLREKQTNRMIRAGAPRDCMKHFFDMGTFEFRQRSAYQQKTVGRVPRMAPSHQHRVMARVEREEITIDVFLELLDELDVSARVLWKEIKPHLGYETEDDEILPFSRPDTDTKQVRYG